MNKNYILAKIRRYINTHQALTIYKSMILPYFCYGDVLMHNLNVGTYDRMQKLQNEALRLCQQKDNRCNVNQLHRDGNTNMLVDRRKANLCNFMYKRKSNNILLQERPRPLRRFEAEVFIEHYSNNQTFEHTVKFQGAKIWNSLPIEERNLRSYDGFKQKQKEKLKLNLLAM